MDRRSFMGKTLGSAALAAAPAAMLAHNDATRPPADIQPDGERKWRIRSWTRAGGAWQPLIAYAWAGEAGFRIEGPIAAADRRLVERWIGERHG